MDGGSIKHRHITSSITSINCRRIGIGMACYLPCCIVAWATATRRQHAKNTYSLTPQFLLLRLVVGLSKEGLELLYESQVLVSLSMYGPYFGEFIMGFGEFLSILCILIFNSKQFKWFQSNLDDSHLNMYYMLPAVLSIVNAIIYCLAACWYGDYAFLLEDVAPGREMDSIADLDQGQQGSPGTLSHGIVPKPDSGGINIEECANSKQEEGLEEPFLATKKNSAYTNRLRLQMATTFLRLFLRAARRRYALTLPL